MLSLDSGTANECAAVARSNPLKRVGGEPASAGLVRAPAANSFADLAQRHYDRVSVSPTGGAPVPEVSLTGLLIVTAVALTAPLLLGFFPRLRDTGESAPGLRRAR